MDLASARAGVEAAVTARVGHFVYVSVARPAPVMRAYVQARAEAEEVLLRSGLAATILRPWYVLGPGHRWPLLLLPAYRILEALPATRPAALRLGLVTIAQMVASLVDAVEHRAEGVRVVTVPEIRLGAASPALIDRDADPLASLRLSASAAGDTPRLSSLIVQPASTEQRPQRLVRPVLGEEHSSQLLVI